MVMHPHLENLSTHTNTSAKRFNLSLKFLPLELPPKLLREPQHLLLLLHRELRPVPLPPPLSAASPAARILRQLAEVPHVARWRRARHFPVEVPVAAAGGALEAAGRVVEGELAAAVGGVAAKGGCMVSQALSVQAV